MDCGVGRVIDVKKSLKPAKPDIGVAAQSGLFSTSIARSKIDIDIDDHHEIDDIDFAKCHVANFATTCNFWLGGCLTPGS